MDVKGFLPVSPSHVRNGKAQARKRSTNPNFWVRISSGGVGVFHMKGGGQKVRYVRESKLLGRISRDFARISRKCLKSLKKSLCSISALKAAQRGSFRPDVPADIPPKPSVRPFKSWKKEQAFWHGHATREKLRSEKLRADFPSETARRR